VASGFFLFQAADQSPFSIPMKQLWLLAVLPLFLTACGQKPADSQGPTSSSGNPVTAPVDYIGAVAKAKQRMEGKIDTIGVTQALQQFAGEKGRYPKDLNELVSAGYLKALPQVPHGMKYSYDPQSGEVKVVPAQ
jgi:hypothetical protein